MLIGLYSFLAPRRSGWGAEPALIPMRTFGSRLLEFNQALTFDSPADIEAGAEDTKMERTASRCVTGEKAGERSQRSVSRSRWHTPCNGFFTEM
jgi:hypothetical protein